jgi:hypothetical protein
VNGELATNGIGRIKRVRSARRTGDEPVTSTGPFRGSTRMYAIAHRRVARPNQMVSAARHREQNQKQCCTHRVALPCIHSVAIFRKWEFERSRALRGLLGIAQVCGDCRRRSCKARRPTNRISDGAGCAIRIDRRKCDLVGFYSAIRASILPGVIVVCWVVPWISRILIRIKNWAGGCATGPITCIPRRPWGPSFPPVR